MGSMGFPDFIEQLYELNVGIIGKGDDRHERPHKPVMLLAVADLFAAGQTDATVPWSAELRHRFKTYFEIVRRRNDKPTPENPFLYLRSEGFWQPVRVTGSQEQPLASAPKVGDLDSGQVFARLPDWLVQALADPRRREQLREALISRYFADSRDDVVAEFEQPRQSTAAEPGPAWTSHRRNGAFSRLVTRNYDHQCAACGLRLVLDEPRVTLVDAAHLVPFKVSHDDHPTNGMALCKNHHWAMDRHLIAPGPDQRWHVSRRLDARKSRAAAELLELEGKPLLRPGEPAYRPRQAGLEWRLGRLDRGL